MNQFRKKTIQIIAFVIIILPLLSVTTIQITGYIREDQMLMYNSKISTYTEDFDDTLFMDPITNVDGWGIGTITGERNIEVLPLGFIETPHDARGLAIQGRKAYVAFYNKTNTLDSFGCVELSDPTDLKLLSTRASFVGMASIAIDGDKLFVGKYNSTISNYAQLGSYNASEPFNLGSASHYLDNYAVGGDVTDIDIEGRYVYFTSYMDSGGKSLRLADTADPDNLIEYTPNWNSDKALGLEVTYPLAYIAASDEGFYILNVTNKSQPIELGHINLPGNATDVIIDGSVAYVTLGEAGVAAIDISNPAAPTVLATYDTPGIARHMALQGNTLFITCGLGGIVVLDVADRTHLTYATGFNVPNAWDVGLYGGIVVITSDLGVHTFQCSAAGGGIANFGNTYYENVFSDLEVWDIRVKGDIAYIAGGPDGFYTLNVRDPNHPFLLDHYDTPSTHYRKIDVCGPYAYLVGLTNMTIFNIQNPNNIILENSVVGSQLGDIFVAGPTSYVSWHLGGMAIINSSIPEQFNLGSGEFSEPHFGTNITGLWVAGYHIYCVDYVGLVADGLLVRNQIDMTSTYQTDGRMYNAQDLDLFVDGDITITAAPSWTKLHNVSDPYNLAFVNNVVNGTGGNEIGSQGVWGFGPFVIVTGPAGTYMVDTTVFTAQTASWYVPTSGAKAVTTSGDYTYVANRTNLIILRHFKSAADTYFDTFRFAQSKSIFSSAHGKIQSITIDYEGWIPDGTVLEVLLTDTPTEITSWVTQTPGIAYTPIDIKQDLYWRVILSYESDRSPHLYELTIEITYTNIAFDISDPLWIGILAGAGALLIIIIVVIVVVSIKKKKKVATR